MVAQMFIGISGYMKNGKEKKIFFCKCSFLSFILSFFLSFFHNCHSGNLTSSGAVLGSGDIFRVKWMHVEPFSFNY